MNEHRGDIYEVFSASAEGIRSEVDALRYTVVDELAILSKCHAYVFKSSINEMFQNDVKRKEIINSIPFDNMLTSNKQDNAVLSYCTIINHLITRIESVIIQKPEEYKTLIQILNNGINFTPMEFIDDGANSAVNMGSRPSILIIIFFLIRDEWIRENILTNILEHVQKYASKYLEKGNKIMSTDSMMTLAILINTQLKNIELHASTMQNKLKIFNIFILLQAYLLILSIQVSNMNPLIFNRLTGNDYDPIANTYKLIAQKVNYVTENVADTSNDNDPTDGQCTNINTAEIDKYNALLFNGIPWYVNVYRSFINMMMTSIYKREQQNPDFNVYHYAYFIMKRFVFDSIYESMYITRTVQTAKALVLLYSIQNYIYNTDLADDDYTQQIVDTRTGRKDAIKTISISDINTEYLKKNNNAISLLLNPLDKNVAINNIDLMKGTNILLELKRADETTLKQYRETGQSFPPLIGDGKAPDGNYKGGTLDYVYIIRSLNANVVDNIMFISYTIKSLHEILNDPLSLLVHPLHLSRTYNGPIMQVYSSDNRSNHNVTAESESETEDNDSSNSINMLKLLQIKQLSTFTVVILLIIIIIMIITILAPSNHEREAHNTHSHRTVHEHTNANHNLITHIVSARLKRRRM